MKPRDDELEQERLHIVEMLRNLFMFLDLGTGCAHVQSTDTSQEREYLICLFVSLQKVIPSLPVGERDVIRLVGWEGLTQTEAAESLGIRESSVRKRLMSAATRIQQKWRGVARRRRPSGT